MKLPSTPSPFPTLREGYNLGAPEHRGFIGVWNWLCNIMRKAADYFCLGVNGRTGSVNVIAGNGIDVTTEGNTVMISVGSGRNTDNGEGGGNGGGSGGGSSGGNGGGSGSGIGGDGDDGLDWTNPIVVPTPPPDPSESGTQCNDWSEGVDNGWSDGAPSNEGDNCAELNGW